MAYVRKVPTASGATAVQVVHKSHGEVIKLEHIGSAHNEADLKTLLSLAKQRLQGNQLAIFPNKQDHLHIYQRRSVPLLLYGCLKDLYCQLGFDELDDKIFANLIIARIVEPTSKLDSIRVLSDLGIDDLRNTTIHRCLQRVVANNYRDKLAKLCFSHASQGAGITLVLYDVTTLYFEVQKEDADDSDNKGYRKPGMSKERRLEPQIIVGLLVDQNGFPLELHSFEGNKAETKTILPVIEAFK